MTTIKLDVKKDWRVIVMSLDANGNDDKRGGNLDLPGGSEVSWKADSSPGWVDRYEVTFSELAKPNERIWPFADAKPVDQILKVPRGQTVTLTAAGNGQQVVKYDVRAEVNSAGQEKPAPYDPVIIIRPGLRSIVAAGLPWALAGAALGAVVTALLSRQPM
jgi:hypothetical protein